MGQSVLVQNQAGNHGKRWARTGTVVEAGPRQYSVRVDGSRNGSIRNRNFLKTFKRVADMMAEDVPQQHPDDEDGPAAQIIRQEEVDGDQSKTIDLGGGDNGGNSIAEKVPLPALPLLPQGRDARGTNAGEDRRYPGREKRKPTKFSDFEIDKSG